MALWPEKPRDISGPEAHHHELLPVCPTVFGEKSSNSQRLCTLFDTADREHSCYHQ